jgi:hypothetical protein
MCNQIAGMMVRYPRQKGMRPALEYDRQIGNIDDRKRLRRG